MSFQLSTHLDITVKGLGKASLLKFLETGDNILISSDILAELEEIDLKNNILELDEKASNQKRGTAIRTKFASPYPILFITDLKEKLLKTFYRSSQHVSSCNKIF